MSKRLRTYTHTRTCSFFHRSVVVLVGTDYDVEVSYNERLVNGSEMSARRIRTDFTGSIIVYRYALREFFTEMTPNYAVHSARAERNADLARYPAADSLMTHVVRICVSTRLRR